MKGYLVTKEYIDNVLSRKNSTKGKTWTCDEIVDLLTNKDVFVINSLIMLYSKQTEQEKEGKSTKEENGVGFNQYDSKALTDIYDKMVKYGKITMGQLELVRKKIIKYRNQLVKIANYEI